MDVKSCCGHIECADACLGMFSCMMANFLDQALHADSQGKLPAPRENWGHHWQAFLLQHPARLLPPVHCAVAADLWHD